MKKLFFLSTMLLIGLVAQAQTLKVSPKMKKGDVRTYETVAKSNAAGKDVGITSNLVVKVIDETADGYVLNMRATDFKSDISDTDFMGRLMTLSEEMINNIDIEVATDKDGKPLKIRNYEKVRQQTTDYADKVIDALMESVPGMKDMMPKETLKQQLLSSMTEEMMLRGMLLNSSVLVLNGKTIATGMQDEYVNEQSMKMKRMYLVTGDKRLTTTSTLNMSKDEMKQLVIDKVTETMPEQAEMIKQNIDAVMSSGMMKFEATEKANYELGDDGWVKSITIDNQSDLMGQKVTTNTTLTLK